MGSRGVFSIIFSILKKPSYDIVIMTQILFLMGSSYAQHPIL